MKKFSELKIKNQLIIVYCLAIVLPMITLGTYLILNTTSLLTGRHIEQIESDNIRVRSIFLDFTSLINSVGDDIASDEELQDVLSADSKAELGDYNAYTFHKKFNKYVTSHSEIYEINIYTEREIAFESERFKIIDDSIRETSWYKLATSRANPGYTTIFFPRTSKNSEWELCYVRRIPVIETGEYAVLVITTNRNHLKMRIENNNLNTDISINDEMIFYSTQTNNISLEPGIEIDTSKYLYSYTGKADYFGEKALVAVSSLIPGNTTEVFYIMTIDKTAYPYIMHIQQVCLILTLICIAVPLMMISMFTKFFGNRIQTLRKVMHQVSEGNYSIEDDINGSDELTEVFSDLNKMIEDIKEKDKEIYTVHISEEKFRTHQQKIQYELLASQINPHFLYNTLETIRMLAFSEGNKEVANAIKLLGKSMRHVLDNSLKTVTLKSEIEYIENYLAIQHMRFGERISYEITAFNDVDADNYYILPLLIQPLVENAINHGVEVVNNKGLIKISFQNVEDYLVISVSDNGVGMTLEEYNKIFKRISNAEHKRKHIGLHNINQRIKIFYGDRYGMDVETYEGAGSCIMLYLPRESGGEEVLDEHLYGK